MKVIPGGRIISFNVGKTTFINMYLPSGTVGKSEREDMLASLIPNLMLEACSDGLVMADFNCIDNTLDATHSAEEKLSPGLKRLAKIHGWRDCFRRLHPTRKSFSFVYKRNTGEGNLREGGARLDRSYSWGELHCEEAEYWPIPFSDHMGHKVKIIINDCHRAVEPRFRPYFKTRPEIARDEEFKTSVGELMEEWRSAKDMMPLTEWWEVIKREVRKVAKAITTKRKKERQQRLTFLMLLQSHLAEKISSGQFQKLQQFRAVQLDIMEWFEKRAEEVALLANIQDVEESEKTRIYHHEKLYNARKKSSILKLVNSAGELAEGHEQCAKLLNEEAKDLLGAAPALDPEAQEELLENLTEVFTKDDNEMLEKDITDEEVKESLLRANRSSAPGSDGLSYSVYIQCWDSLGPPLCEVLRHAVREGKMCESMKHTYLIYSPKVGKESSTRVRDLRKLSLLQTDFKVLSGVLANRLKKTETHTLSKHQYSTGGKRASHSACLARNAIENIKPNSKGCAIIETDFVSAFDRMSVSWIWKVLLKKGCSERFTSVLRNLYEDTDSYVSCIINNEQQPRMVNRRKNIRQGDRNSTSLYVFGADALLITLNKRLKGLEYFKMDTQGPRHPLFGPPRPVSEKLTVVGFVDDVKGVITSVQEFNTLDNTLRSFELATGSKLHRNANSRKCNCLTLGRWSRWSQADSPLDYMSVVSEINFLGITLTRSSGKTRAANGQELVGRVQRKLNIYKSGRHSPLICKPYTANIFLLSKISYRSGVTCLKASDIQKMQTALKQWICQELLQKPSEVLLYREKCEGGLELVNVTARAYANVIKNFLDLSHSQSKNTSLYMNAVFRAHVLEEEDMKKVVKKPTFFTQLVYDSIKEAFEEEGDSIFSLSTKAWQLRLTRRLVTHSTDPQSGLTSLILSNQEEKMQSADWADIWANMRCPGLSPTEQSFLFKMVNGLLPSKSKLLRFGIEENDQCFFCNEKDDKDHFLSCTQASSMGEATRNILSELSPNKKEVSWQQICSLDLHLPPVQRLPAFILISELGLEIQNTRAKKKKLTPGIFTSKLRFRAEVVGGSKKHQDAKCELISWIENKLNTQVPATERVAALDDGSGVAVATSQDSEKSFDGWNKVDNSEINPKLHN